MMKARLLVSLLLIWLAADSSLAKVYLVSAGISDYPGTENDLRVSDNDAKTIANVFKAAENSVVSILVNEQVTASALLNALRSTFSPAKKEDTVILFFSGHGAPGALACYDGLLPYQHVFDVLKECQSSKKIILADACFAGKMRARKKQESFSYFNHQKAMLFLSSRSNEKSFESSYRNSMFTLFLERGLRGGADVNKDRTITAIELFNFVHNGVTEATEQLQHPVMWGRFDHQMPVIKW